jgi:hypothetical protein
MYHIRALTASGTVSVALAGHIVVACKQMWQIMRAYQTICNNPCPHINAELLLVSTQYSVSYNSHIKCFRTHVYMNIITQHS